MSTDLSKGIMLIGMIILVIGFVFYVFGDKLSWVGRLPGDIRIEKENFKFYFPLTTLVLLSVLLNVLLRIFKKFM
jgi:hypothetical protein